MILFCLAFGLQMSLYSSTVYLTDPQTHTTNGFGNDGAISPVLLCFFILKNYSGNVGIFFPINSLTFSDFSVWSLLSLWFWVQLSWIFILPSISFFPSQCVAAFFCCWKPSSLSPDFTEDPGKWQWLRLLQSDLACCVDSLQVSPDRGISFFICTRLQRASAKIANLVVGIHW